MNIKEYISTGVLEAYVLGELSGHERAELERNLLLYPELRSELLLVEKAQEELLMHAAIQPRKEVKARLFNKADSSTGKQKVLSGSTGLASWFWPYAAAACFALAVVSSYFAIDYRSRWKQTSSNLSELMAQNARIAENYNQVDQQLDKLQRDVNVIDNPSFTRIMMIGTENAPQASASVYWNDSTQEVYLRIHNVKELARQSQYQLWAIIDGKPVDAGVFDADVEGLVRMKSVAKGASTFAVTIEPRGGKQSPSLETMQMAGNVTKG